MIRSKRLVCFQDALACYDPEPPLDYGLLFNDIGDRNKTLFMSGLIQERATFYVSFDVTATGVEQPDKVVVWVRFH